MRGGGSEALDPRVDRSGLRVCLAVSRFNGLVTGRLEKGARKALAEAGVPDEQVDSVRVAGAWELPHAVRRVLGDYDAVVALGCVVRGETPHFDYICDAASTGLMECQAAGEAPVGFGLLTTETLQQGLQRAGGKHGNKGAEAAEAALELVDLFRRGDEGRDGGAGEAGENGEAGVEGAGRAGRAGGEG